LDIYSNRELAAILWVLILIAFVCFSSRMEEVRKASKQVVVTFFVWKIQAVNCLMLIYISISVYFLAELGIWEVGQLKNTLIWTCSVAFMSMFKVEAIKKDRLFFKHAVLDNLKLVAIIQFIIGAYSFSLLTEFLVLPILSCLGFMSAIADSKKEYAPANVLINWLLVAYGVFLIGYTLYMLFIQFGVFATEQRAYDFLIPPLLTLLFLPFIFSLMVYMAYENVMVRLPYFIKGRRYKVFAQLAAMLAFNVRIELLDRWASSFSSWDTESYSGILKSIWAVFRMRSAEKRMASVRLEDGWSPYLAKDALASKGFITGYYHSLYDEWFAQSQYVEIGDGILTNNIAYYINGDENTAKHLKLVMNVNNLEAENETRQCFFDACFELYKYAIAEEIPQCLVKSLEENNTDQLVVGQHDIRVTKEDFINMRNNGYSVKFEIFVVL